MFPSDPDHPDPSSTAPVTPPASGPVAAGPTPAVDAQAASLTVPPALVPRRSEARTWILGLAVVVVALLGSGAMFLSGFLVGQRVAEQPGTPVAAEDGFQAFWDSYKAITSRFALGGETEQSLVNGAIKGMVDSLGDPYSAYLTPEQYRQGLQDLSGQFEGIGAEIATTDASGKTSDCTTLGADCRLTITNPLDGSPAQKAGLRPGDVITAVDGVNVDGLTVDGTRDRIRGPKGTTVTLTVARGSAPPLDIQVVRDVIVQKEVVTRSLGGGAVGYLQVTGFSDNSASTFHDALAADLKAGRKAIILDLRGNPGGYVTAAQKIASEFIAKGPIFWEQSADGSKTETDATGQGIATDASIKLVVLVDKGSASASEIVTGALQDTKRATVVGETSFGKGTVQEWIQLQDGSALKLTIAKWLTPQGRWIHHVGIVPDVAVAAPTDPTSKADPQLDRAVEILTAPTAAAGPLEPAA